MYERSRIVVRCVVGQTEEFNVEVGLHQGSALSPFLFAIVMDQLSEEVRQESPWTMMFADDIVICSEIREQVEENLERWRFALERRGMKVSRSKTEYMCVNEREGSGTVRLQGEEVKKVQEFKYLGSTVQSNGECGKEVKKRVQAGWNGWRKVSGVLCDRKISARIKGKVYRTVVRPAMLYGLETVSLRKRQESELEVAELKMLRFSLGVTRLDRIRNEYIRGTAHVGRLGVKVREARLRWFGHVQRRENAPPISQAPVLMLRPRAWNIVEHNMLVNGQEIPGPLFDFGLLMFHNAKLLLENQSGPFFYLSKVESYLEARLWNQIFLWTEDRLGLPVGSIKATVLIECVLATFEMEEILYELKEHSAGLNCGIWDYSASFVNKFGHRAEFLLPDRSKYVNMEKRFLRSYMDLLVQTCHRRGALATGGMAALLLPPQRDRVMYKTVLSTVTRLKLLEIKAGVDGFMVYDMNLIEPMQKLFQIHSTGENQLQELRNDVSVTPEDLLTMPAGGVTLYGLKHNIAVGVLFIEAWLSGRGHFFFKGQVEDSATAEISRSQVWQWIRHQVKLEDDGNAVVTRGFVRSLTQGMLGDLRAAACSQTQRDGERLITAVSMFLELVQKNDFPEFLTTYLYLDHTFLSSQGQHEDRETDRSHRAKL
ncbi:hypothetical protein QTP70_017123 [Hemibagrus guttatus]|uniref:Reverse transcriptase domain-containing protein n=1 Tax=Hemibagrus guttatus TaxID=175788 RepID=A0AAE0V266_9TELE|nr:hypothetical protein QTP70_017123 [Hemibagrus guttatus]